MNSGNIPDILEEIVLTKQEEISAYRKTIPDFQAEIKEIPPALDFRQALAGSGLAVIAEIKKASPSAGIIVEDFTPVTYAEAYSQGGANAISVLTDQQYFQGSPVFLQQIRATTKLPVLRKDFIISPIQIYEARALGADSFLLITAILSQEELADMLQLGRELGMEALVEVHDEAELTMAIEAGAGIIGVNNRNLHTFEVNLTTAVNLYPLIPTDTVTVAESGIRNPENAHRLRNTGFDAVLVGESLMRQGRDGCGTMISQFKKG